MSFIALEKLHNLQEGYRRVFQVGGASYLLIHEDGQTHLILNRCPHAGADLSASSIGAGRLRCPRHGAEFELQSGRSLTPVCSGALTRVPVIYEGNTLGIMSSS